MAEVFKLKWIESLELSGKVIIKIIILHLMEKVNKISNILVEINRKYLIKSCFLINFFKI